MPPVCGAVVDERALVAHLQAHPNFRAGLDVFEDEPLMAPGLAECENAVVVPHIASATQWTRAGMVRGGGVAHSHWASFASSCLLPYWAGSYCTSYCRATLHSSVPSVPEPVHPYLPLCPPSPRPPWQRLTWRPSCKATPSGTSLTCCLLWMGPLSPSPRRHLAL